MINLNQLVHDCNPFTPFLYLTHTTIVTSFRDIVKEKKISKKKCNIFGDELIYLFYGRADYSPNTLPKYHSVVGQMPVTILVKCDPFSSFFRISPFDTGAFITNKFKDVFGIKTQDENKLYFNNNLALNNNYDTPSKLVTLFYSNSKNFVSGTFSPSATITHCLDARNCKDLADNRTNANYDGRNTSIEVQVNMDIPLDPSFIEMIFLPEDSMTMFDDDLNALNITFDYYPPGPPAETSESMGKIKTLLYQYYKNNKKI